MLDSVAYAYEKYHPQTFLEECKYVQEKMKTKNYIDEELKSESDNDNDMILILILIMITKNKFRKKINQIVIMTNKFFKKVV